MNPPNFSFFHIIHWSTTFLNMRLQFPSATELHPFSAPFDGDDVFAERIPAVLKVAIIELDTHDRATEYVDGIVEDLGV